MNTFFFKVDESAGISAVRITPLLTRGRSIRWQSSNGDHGLIEATLSRNVTNPLDYIEMRDVGRTNPGSLYIERIKEIALTEDEAKSFGLGWPY